MKEAIDYTDLGCVVITHAKNLFDSREVLNDLIKCDNIFGCADSVEGARAINKFLPRSIF